MKTQRIALLAWIAACGSEGASNDIEELNGTWRVVYAGIADTATPDDQLTEPAGEDPAYQLTLMSGAGIERVTGDECVTQHSVSLKWNDNGTGTITEVEDGTVVSGDASLCGPVKNYSLFSAGATELQRVSYVSC